MIIVPTLPMQEKNHSLPITENERIRYGDEELEKFKNIILKLKEGAEKDYEFYKGMLASGEDTTRSTSFDSGSEQNDDSQIIMMARKSYEKIAQCNAALTRIINKTYGICQSTKKLISKERLRAFPLATTSIEKF